MFFLFATFCWSNASLFCYIVLQYIGCFLCFFLYFLFSLCCWVGVVNICILSSLLSIIRRSWSSYSPILALSCFFLLYFVEMCISYGVLVCCISLKCAFFAMVFFFVECIIVLLLCDAIHYRCDVMTSLNFYLIFLKNVSLLLWVVVLVIVVFFLCVDMSWWYFKIFFGQLQPCFVLKFVWRWTTCVYRVFHSCSFEWKFFYLFHF